jgi:hypothetical protein
VVKNKFDGWASTEIAPYYTTVEYELGRDILSQEFLSAGHNNVDT